MKREKAFIKANGSLSDLLEVADWLWQYLRKNFGKSEAYTLNVEESKKVCSAFSKRYGLEYGFQAEKYIKGLIYDREVAQKYSIEFPTNFGQYNIVMFKRNSTDSLNCITNIIHKFMTTKKTTPKKDRKEVCAQGKKDHYGKENAQATEKQLAALKKAREARAEAKKAEKKAAKAKAEAKKTITKAKATAKKVKASAKKSIKKALTTAKKQVRKTVSKATTSTRKRITKSTKAIIDRTAKSLKKKGLAGCSNLDAANCLFYYMWNDWSEDECLKIFGKVMGDHFFAKWNHYDGNFERLWADMSDEYREKLLNRAIEVQSAKKKNFLKTLQNS